MKRPYVICHMASTIDGRIIGENWGANLEKYSEAYEACHNHFESQAWMVGRVTMEKDFTEGHPPAPVRPDKSISRIPFVGDQEASSFAIAVDAQGKLGWTENEIDGDHVIEILSEAVTEDYLQYLQNMKISYIFAGKDKIDFNAALSQLHEHFGIEKLMLEGGGHINGSLLNAALIDEISILVLPIADGTMGAPTSFEVSKYLKKTPATQLQLIDVHKLKNDVIWLKYKVSGH